MKFKEASAAVDALGGGITLRRVVGASPTEYKVNYRGGKQATAYYTNDLADAVNTAQRMAADRINSVSLAHDDQLQAFVDAAVSACVAEAVDLVKMGVTPPRALAAIEQAITTHASAELEYIISGGGDGFMGEEQEKARQAFIEWQNRNAPTVTKIPGGFRVQHNEDPLTGKPWEPGERS